MGFDSIDEAIAALNEGMMDATLIHDTYQIGQYIVPMMVDIADGKITETTKAWVDVALMTPENMAEIGF